MKHGPVQAFALLAAALFALAATPAAADSVGPYYATPSWDQTLPASTRFIVLSNMNSEAVLDRETGLVWQRTPSVPQGSPDVQQRSSAIFTCWNASTGGRKGWRLPRAEELLSLGQPFALGGSPLPAGNPFVGVIEGNFWAVDRVPGTTIVFGIVVGFTMGNPAFFIPADASANIVSLDASLDVWCVRGEQGSPSS